MKFCLGGLILLIAGWVIRRLLHMDNPVSGRKGASGILSSDRQAIYSPISLEVETQVAILSISLNDAINERDAGHPEIAWHLVTLSVSGWQRVAEMVTTLLDTLQENIPKASAIVPYRGIVARRFQSQVMIDHLRMHELLDQLVYRSRMRFYLQVHMLRKATAKLTTEFRRAHGYGQRTDDQPPELWQRLDMYLHDFDLVTKEALMAFRSFLICVPHSALASLAAEFEPVIRKGVRTAAVNLRR